MDLRGSEEFAWTQALPVQGKKVRKKVRTPIKKNAKSADTHHKKCGHPSQKAKVTYKSGHPSLKLIVFLTI